MDNEKSALLEDIAKLYEKQRKYPEAIRYYEKLVQARNGNVASVIYFNMGKDLLIESDNFKTPADSLIKGSYLVKADSAFGKVIYYSPNSYLGYYWRARASADLDPETTKGLAKDDYKKAVALLELKNDTKKYAAELLESYRYLGYYYYLLYDGEGKTGDAAAREQAKSDSMNYWQKVLAIDPANDVAKKALAVLK
jgi:tetratricopeptide (TPR) repeat protein